MHQVYRTQQNNYNSHKLSLELTIAIVLTIISEGSPESELAVNHFGAQVLITSLLKPQPLGHN